MIGQQNKASRRSFLAGAGATLSLAPLAGCMTTPVASPPPPSSLGFAPPPLLPRLRIGVDRITAITVCTRPFRAEGPRLEIERVGDKRVVHHYGHGGSGWSLSWGSATLAVEKVRSVVAEGAVAVIGCGAIGLTTALLLQRAGFRVTIYAKDFPPNVRSTNATGSWTPNSRICLESGATPAFRARWERMSRESFRVYQTLLGLPGAPVEWVDNYFLTDPEPRAEAASAPESRPPFADHLQREQTPDLVPRSVALAPGEHPFGQHQARRSTGMMFNIGPYTKLLVEEFLEHGGRFETRVFHSLADFRTLRETIIVNCTGYGAKDLCRDETVIPVRGQLAHLIPQADVHYGLYYNNVSFVPRRDGLVVQQTGTDEYYGYGDDGTAPDRDEAEQAVRTIAGLFDETAA
jgi:glycine/D-amino acid oxidase-like deaminating enzyme